MSLSHANAVQDLLPRKALKVLPATLCERWAKLRMGGGRVERLEPVGPALAVWFAEACWWGDPVDDALRAELFERTELFELVGLEAATRALNAHAWVDETLAALDACGTDLARAHGLTARAYQHQSTAPSEARRLHLEALALLEGEDAWSHASVCRSLTYLAMEAGDRAAEEEWVARSLELRSPLALDLSLAIRCLHQPERFDLGEAAERITRTGPARMAGRVRLAQAFRVVEEDGLAAGVPGLEALLESGLLRPAQASVPRIAATMGSLIAGDVERARRLLSKLNPNNARQEAWKHFVEAWANKLSGQVGWAVKLEGLARSVERFGALPSALEPFGALLAAAPEEGPTLRGMCGRVQHRWGLEGSVRAEAVVPLGGWEIERAIAAGGQGSVWSARRRHTHERAVVKWLPAATRQIWRREIRALCQLDHPHVVPVHDALVVDEVASAQSGGLLEVGAVGLVLPRAQGSLLDHAPAPEQVVPVLKAVLDALAHVHARGVVHYDIKEANLLFRDAAAADMGVWLTDFGTATAAWGSEVEGLGGTPDYMAPEQRAGNVAQLGPWSDLYAMGSMARRWVSGGEWEAWLAGLRSVDPRDRPTAAEALRTLPSALSEMSATNAGGGSTTWTFGSAEATGFIERIVPHDVVALPRQLPPSAPTANRGWSGLLAWREPPWVPRDGLLEGLWAALVEVEQTRRCKVVRVAGVGRGRRRLFRELVERAARTDACLARDVQLSPQVTLIEAIKRSVARTSLASMADRMQDAPPVEVLRSLAKGTLLRRAPTLLTVGSQAHDTAWVDAVNGAEGWTLVVLADESGEELSPMTTEQMVQLGVSLAGLDAHEAERLAVEREGCPGWFVATLGVLERGGLLSGGLGERSITGAWSATRQGTILRQLSFVSDPAGAEAALAALHEGEEADPAAVELLLNEGLARVLHGTAVPVDTWYR